jgi:predicted transcriptional regulator
MSKPITIAFNTELTGRLQHLISTRGQSAETILTEALQRYLDQEQERPAKNYPQRSPVGGIITPV